jgi:hypothetical protein
MGAATQKSNAPETVTPSVSQKVAETQEPVTHSVAETQKSDAPETVTPSVSQKLKQKNQLPTQWLKHKNQPWLKHRKQPRLKHKNQPLTVK